ncbi:MAG TPA: type IV pilus secretin PilQ [Elusimicrobiota bacterium]|nr:type IV pilus secretin PilQ [Elusimicrobiota bacterium]HVC09718.1 type IV pilus secretin PilQ [Elusimicrobiota bacterium]
MTTAQGLARTLEKSTAGLLSLLLAASPAMAGAPAAAKASVQAPAAVRSISIKGDEVRIGLDGRASYEDFILSQPPRIVLQISNATYHLSQKDFPGQGVELKGVRAGQFATAPVPVARVVLDLTKAIAYHVAMDGDDLLVSLAAKAAGEVKAAAPAPAAPAARVPAATSSAQASPAAVPAAPETETDQQAPIDILGRLPTDKVTLDFDQTDVRDIFQLFAAKAGINIIYGPDIQGQLTLHLNKVPFNEAFRTVLDMLNLTTVQVGNNILRVLTPAALTKVQSEAATTTQIIPLNYAKASDLASTIQQIITAEKIPGEAISDSKTNSVIVTASPSSLTQIAQMVEQLDVRPKEVLIEAKMVEVSLDNSLDYGIQWNEVSQGANGGGTDYTGLPFTETAPTGGTSGTNSQLSYSNFLANQPGKTIPSLGSAVTGTGVSLAPTSAFGALTLGRITSHYILNATLSAAAAANKVKILSDPKIATLNNQPANINVVTNVPYVTTTIVAGNTGTNVPQTVNYATEGIQLTVTPLINADGRITLTINPNVSQPSATASANAATGAPALDTRSAQTTVMVKNGDTVVIGGLIQDSVTNDISKIPLLGDIPILGWLFKSTHKVHNRNELLIFVTPTIMTD